MKQSLQLKLGQHLTMTPQLQQAIKLLQLSSLELAAEIQEALDSNPMLESEEELSRSDPKEEFDTPVEPSSQAPEKDIPTDLAVDTQWDDIYPTASPSGQATPTGDRDFIFSSYHEEEDLKSHLNWQLELLSLSQDERLIANTLIDAINERGYLPLALTEIQAILSSQNVNVSLEQVEHILHEIQSFEPTGVGARNLRECLSLQARQLSRETPFLSVAIALIDKGLEQVGQGQASALKKRLQIDDETLNGAVALIQSLNPYPGHSMSSERTEYISPDVVVKKVGHKWKVKLNQEATPKLKINQEYANLIKRADNSKTNNYLKDHLQEAKWFLKSIESRNETLLKVAQTIVEYQQNFLEYGERAMKPMVLNDVAKAIEMHESTISRVTTRKYMLTPRGIYELKFFFSSHVGTDSGGECSSTAIRALIKQFIAKEASDKPLSDNKIALMLKSEGIKVARRTVAKYREAMHIPASSDRKQVNWSKH